MGKKHTIPSNWDQINLKGGSGPHIINAGVMTGTTVIQSSPFNVQNLDNVGLQVKWTGAAVGTIEVIVSVDGVNYDALTFDPVLTQPAGTAGSYVISLNQLPFPYMKVRYTNASSTGVLDVWLSAKDLN